MCFESVAFNLLGFLVGVPVGLWVGFSWRDWHDRKVLECGPGGRHSEPDRD